VSVGAAGNGVSVGGSTVPVALVGSGTGVTVGRSIAIAVAVGGIAISVAVGGFAALPLVAVAGAGVFGSGVGPPSQAASSKHSSRLVNRSRCFPGLFTDNLLGIGATDHAPTNHIANIA